MNKIVNGVANDYEFDMPKEFGVYPGQIKIDNEIFFGVDYKITDLFNAIMEENRNKDKEIERLNTEIDYLNKLRDEDAEELKKKDNTITELQKWLVKNLDDIHSYFENTPFGVEDTYKEVLDKLKELKEGR